MLGLALCLMASANAQWGKRVKGNGEMTTQERVTGDYDGVAVGGFFDVDLVSGTEGTISVKAEENLQEYIITEVKNGILHIKIENGVNLKPSSWKDGIHVTVPVEAIESLSLAGSGDVNSRTTLKAARFSAKISGSGDLNFRVDTDELNASMAGSGDMKISGNAGMFEVNIAGSGDIEAYDLEARSVDASISGSADLHVTASEFIKARVSGSGDIRYRGNPAKIDSKVSGSGEISKG
jgi:hypothetical protein